MANDARNISDVNMNGLLDGHGLRRLVTLVKTWVTQNFFQKPAGENPTLAVEDGGTGMDTNPSMLVNLSSEDPDDVLKANPRPGVTGTLSYLKGNGGLAANTLAMGTGSGVGTVEARVGSPGQSYVTNGGLSSLVARDDGGNFATSGSITATQFVGTATKARAASISTTTGGVAGFSDTQGTFSNVSPGSTGGALYAPASGGARFGTLPIDQGGTGSTSINFTAGGLVKAAYTGTNRVVTYLATQPAVGGTVTNTSPTYRGYKAVYITASGPSACPPVLYGASLPTFSATDFPAGTIFIVTG